MYDTRPEGSLGSTFAGISEAQPYYGQFLVYFVTNYRPHLSHFWENDILILEVPKNNDPFLVTVLKVPEKATPLLSVQS